MSNRLVLAAWLVFILGAAVMNVPIIGLLSLVLVPLGVLGLVASVARIPNSPRLLNAALSALLAGLAVCGVMIGTSTVLAWDRASQPGGSAGNPVAGPGYWLALLGLNLLAVAALATANRRNNLRIMVLLGSTPAAALLGLFVASRFLPLSA